MPQCLADIQEAVQREEMPDAQWFPSAFWVWFLLWYTVVSEVNGKPKGTPKPFWGVQAETRHTLLFVFGKGFPFQD